MPHGSPRPIRSGSASRDVRPVQFQMLQIVCVRDVHPAMGVGKGKHGTVVDTSDGRARPI